jgi:FkbM family methyltransferase
MNERLYLRVRRTGLNIRHCGEIGVYLPETSMVRGFILDGVRTDLFEPAPESLLKIRDAFGSMPHVHIHPIAIHRDSGRIRLYRAGASTFAADLKASPALANDNYLPSAALSFEVDARRFSEVDDGTFDLLSIDTEGCEWYVISHLVSRPLVISVETGWKRYTNPFLKEIKGWMDREGYYLWYRDGSDTVFLRRDVSLGLVRRWCDRIVW